MAASICLYALKLLAALFCFIYFFLLKPFSTITMFTGKYEQKTYGNVNKLIFVQQQKSQEERKKYDKRLTSFQENFETCPFHFQNTAIINLAVPDNLL